MLIAYDIEWDNDNPDIFLPSEIAIPKYVTENGYDDDSISDYISDATGYCHKGFKLRGVI